MSERETPVILEIGPKHCPITQFDPRKNGDYIFPVLDRDKNFITSPQRKKNGLEVLGDLSHLPFKSGSVSEIWLVNVFGVMYAESTLDNLPIIKSLRLYKELAPLLSKPETEPDDWSSHLEELSRTLSPGGRVYVVETITPPPDSWLASIDLSAFGMDQEIHYEEEAHELLSGLRMPLAYKEWFECERIEPITPFIMAMQKIS